MDVFAAMRESLALLRRRQYREVVDRCVPVLDAHPNYVPLRTLLAQALVGLARFSEADAHLRFCLELDPECGAAYRRLGEIELRRDRPKSAARLLDEACRLAPGDREARDLLVEIQRRLGRASDSPLRVPSPADPRARPASEPSARRRRPTAARPGTDARRRLARGTDSPGIPAPGRPATLRDGFGDYLAEIGVLSRAQVRAALIYRRTRGVGLGEAAVALGFVSAPKLRWAAQAYFAASARDD